VKQLRAARLSAVLSPEFLPWEKMYGVSRNMTEGNKEWEIWIFG